MCDHREEWRCGQVTIYFTGRDPSPRFDRRLQIWLDQRLERVDVRKVARLLRILDRLGRMKRRGTAWGS